MTKSDLCNECFEASSPAAKELSSAARAARCQYCGGQPCAGGTDFMAMGTGIQRMKYMCMPCSMEYHRFVQRESRQLLAQGASNLSQMEQIAALQKVQEAAESHMKKWISNRENL
jgi:DNA-directed RNA polymerase subunit RPC12/RpoP